jgi:hypothetical protein
VTTQRKITATEYLAFTDDYARAIQAMVAAAGDDATPDTGAYEAAVVRDAINGFTAADTCQITVDLLPAAMAVVAALSSPTFLQQALAVFNSAISSHLGGDVSAWLVSADEGRVHPLFRQYGNPYLAAAVVFPPATTLGSVAVTGAGAGTFTDSASVDTAKYSGAQIALVASGTIGGADVVVTVHAVLANGSTVTRTGTMPSGSTEGHTVALGSAGDTVVDVSSVTFTGGTAADAFQIVTVEDRSL